MSGRPSLRAELLPIVKALLAASEDARVVSLDAIGDAIGTTAVSTDDVEAILAALERAGRTLAGPRGGGGQAVLKQVLPAARRLASTLGRVPTVDEIARETGLDVERVRHALALGKVMGR